MAQTKVGRILPAAKGTHNPEQGYEQLDIVMAPDGSEVYMARQTVPAGTALSDTNYWMVYAQMGKVFEEFSAKIDQTLGRTVTPQMHGAVGDGENDDTSAFEDALAAAKKDNKNVYVPAGTYKITRTLTIPSGVKMYGDSNISKYTAMGAHNDAYKSYGTGKESILSFHGVKDAIKYQRKCEISNLVICGNGTSDYGVSPDLTVITLESNGVFKDLLIYDFKEIGFTIGSYDTTQGNKAYNNYVYRINAAYCKIGMLCNASDATVVDCQFFRNQLYGCEVRQGQNFLYNVLSFHNCESGKDDQPAKGAEMYFENCTETFLYACAFDSGVIDVGVRLFSNCDIRMHNCRIKGSDVKGIDCDSGSRLIADYLIINNDKPEDEFVPIESRNATSPSLLRDPKRVGVQYALETLKNVVVMDSYNIKAEGGDGGYYQPSVDSSGNLTWTASQEGMPAVAGANIIGPAGPQGEQGPQGNPGKDGNDGYTPIKGIDYFDGKDGLPGKDGDPGVPGKDGADGQPGKDGVSVTHSWNGTILTVTSASGTSSADLKGEKGADGAKGDKGDTGPAGKDGEQGPKGDKGDTGPQGEKGADGAKGADGEKGDKGDKGDTGAPGYTPVRGTDYWTENDQEAIVQQVIAALGTPVFGRVDADNNIILTGQLAEDTYTVKYEDADGNQQTIGTITFEAAPAYTNLFDPATASLNTRMSGSSSTSKAQDGYVMTASIAIPATVIGSSVADSGSYVAVKSQYWAGSANIFYSGDAGRNYADYNSNKGTIVGDWVKIPVKGQWTNTITATSMVVSLYVGVSAITASDIQDIEIYFNELPE